MLDTAFGAIKDFFSVPFLVSLFQPAFIAVAVNVGLLTVYVDSSPLRAVFVDGLGLKELAQVGSVMLMAALLLAFLIAPLLNGVRAALEGEFLPEGVRSYWIRRSRTAALDREAMADEARQYFGALDVDMKMELERLTKAKTAGVATKALSDDHPVQPAAEAMAVLKEAIYTAHGSEREDWDPALGKAARKAFRRAAEALEKALAHNTTNGSLAGANPARAEKIAALKDAHRAFCDLVLSARQTGSLLLSRLDDAARGNRALEDPKPTLFGNLRADMLNYPRRKYGVGFYYLWPRLQLAIEAKEAAFATLEWAKTQLDFCLAFLFLTCLSFIGWILGLAFGGDNPLVYLAVCAAFPVVMYGLYRITAESQRGHTSAVKAAIDGYRLKLLKTLAVKMPANSAAERALWIALSGGDNVEYDHAV